MKPPYTITELDALMHGCVSFTENHEPSFWAGNIAGRDGVTTDIPFVEGMMDWVAEADKGLLESMGFGKDNVVYFRLGRDAQHILDAEGFKKYLHDKTARERIERVRLWGPVGISLLAVIVSVLVWQAPKGNSNRIDDLTTQVSGLRTDQEQIKAMVTTIREDLDTTSVSTNPSSNENSLQGDMPAAPDRIPGVLDQPWLLVASVAMFSFSFFLLYQAVVFQNWVTAKDKTAPGSAAGVTLAVLFSLATVVFSVLYWIVHHPYPPHLVGLNAFLWFSSNSPSELATGPLLGSIIPAAMAIYKFVISSFIMRGNAQESPSLSHSPTAALAGAGFALISLAGSIATLVMFFFWIKEP